MVEKLFVSDIEIARSLGISAAAFKSTVIVLERDAFPPKEPLFNDLRYWPAVKAFFDRRHLTSGKDPRYSPPDGEENWD
ncbi:winged helix-turn-helix domain-containing protein [Ochrobactrum vermis]|nr:winged helix-turn-helix domain-containing protein [Ochrobactrum vermis]